MTNVPQGGPPRHALNDALGRDVPTLAPTNSIRTAAITPPRWLMLFLSFFFFHFPPKLINHLTPVRFSMSTSLYNAAPVLLDEQEGKWLAGIPTAVVYPPAQASWVGKSLSISVWQPPSLHLWLRPALLHGRLLATAWSCWSDQFGGRRREALNEICACLVQICNRSHTLFYFQIFKL